MRLGRSGRLFQALDLRAAQEAWKAASPTVLGRRSGAAIAPRGRQPRVTAIRDTRRGSGSAAASVVPCRGEVPETGRGGPGRDPNHRHPGHLHCAAQRFRRWRAGAAEGPLPSALGMTMRSQSGNWIALDPRRRKAWLSGETWSAATVPRPFRRRLPCARSGCSAAIESIQGNRPSAGVRRGRPNDRVARRSR